MRIYHFSFLICNDVEQYGFFCLHYRVVILYHSIVFLVLSLNQSILFPTSIQTLVKISKTAGARLKPHASRLIPALLEALSTLEPQVLNYLSLRATEQEKVTSAVF